MLQVTILIIIFLTGLATGSFLNCLIYRLEISQSSFLGRSRCPKCEHRLVWRDLIPVLSFIFLKGKCRYCRQKISWQYPLVEIFTALIFLLLFLFVASSTNYAMAYFLLIGCFLLVIFVYDLKHYIIPDEIIYPAIVIAFLNQALGFFSVGFQSADFYPLINSFLSAFFSSAFFFSIVLISRGQWMGFGDVKLAFFMGLFLAFPGILIALFSAFLIGAIIGIGLVALKKKTLKSEVPFGPFLVLGTFIALFFGEKIIEWYSILAR